MQPIDFYLNEIRNENEFGIVIAIGNENRMEFVTWMIYYGIEYATESGKHLWSPNVTWQPNSSHEEILRRCEMETATQNQKPNESANEIWSVM